MGDRVFILGHHYQRDEVIELADVTGDSFKLARDAAARPDAPYIVFCGVHFMAESADILTAAQQQVVLPDLAAGCSMADMARLGQVEEAWERLVDAGVAGATVPITYMNSSADIKAFTGRHGGAVCTSSTPSPHCAGRRAWQKVTVPPDQHSAAHRGPRARALLADCVVVDPHKPGFGSPTSSCVRDVCSGAALLGARSVHGRERRRRPAKIPGVQVPSTRSAATRSSRRRPRRLDGVHISTIDGAPAGSAWAVGTEPQPRPPPRRPAPDKTVVSWRRPSATAPR